jgi:CHASE3 domain sensor protein
VAEIRESESARVAAEACSSANRAQMLARAALIIACMAIAVAILGMFLPIR